MEGYKVDAQDQHPPRGDGADRSTDLENRRESAVVSKRFVRTPLGTGSVVLDTEANELLELNETATSVFEGIEAGHSAEAIAERLCTEYDVAEQEARSAVEALARRFFSEPPGLLAESSTVVSSEAQGREEAKTFLLRWTASEGGTPEAGDRVATGTAPSGAVVAYVVGTVLRTEGDEWEGGARGDGQSVARHLAMAFERNRKALMERLRGAFLVAFYEPHRRRVTVVRDALGVHPAFYRWQHGELVVAPAPWDLPYCDPTDLFLPGLAENLLGISHPLQMTESLYRGVGRIPGGCFLVAEPTGTRIERFYNPLPEGFAWATSEEAGSVIDGLSLALSRCRGWGADSIALSGGYDSVALAVLASRDSRFPPLKAVCLEYEGVSCGEGAVQRRVGEELHLAPSFSRVQPYLEEEGFLLRSLAHGRHCSTPTLGVWQGLFGVLAEDARRRGLGHIVFGTGGDEMFTVDPSFALDLARAGEASELVRFFRAWQRSSPFSGWTVSRFLVRHALRLQRHAWLRSAEALSGAVRHGAEFGRRLRPLRLPIENDRVLAEVRERGLRARGAQRWDENGFYRAALRDLVMGPLLQDELEQTFQLGRGVGLRIALPFFDRDVVDLALRIRPSELYAEGRMKSPLRSLVRRALAAPLPARKVDFSKPCLDVLRRSARMSWEACGGGIHLERQGLLSARASTRRVEAFVAGSSDEWLPLWRLLSLESWLQHQKRAASRP